GLDGAGALLAGCRLRCCCFQGLGFLACTRRIAGGGSGAAGVDDTGSAEGSARVRAHHFAAVFLFRMWECIPYCGISMHDGDL
ncbi:hypothetical protein, partial [Salmonella enterica]|uniref:hypothetical protein n=1 Tax=Salmonella enterica TaxID=28901 RepID=UPI003CEAA595